MHVSIRISCILVVELIMIHCWYCCCCWFDHRRRDEISCARNFSTIRCYVVFGLSSFFRNRLYRVAKSRRKVFNSSLTAGWARRLVVRSSLDSNVSPRYHLKRFSMQTPTELPSYTIVPFHHSFQNYTQVLSIFLYNLCSQACPLVEDIPSPLPSDQNDDYDTTEQDPMLRIDHQDHMLVDTILLVWQYFVVVHIVRSRNRPKRTGKKRRDKVDEVDYVPIQNTKTQS